MPTFHAGLAPGIKGCATPQNRRHWPEYGLGLARADLGGVQVWTHTGDSFGFHADLAYIPAQEITVAATVNKQTNAPGQDALIDALLADVSDSAER